MEDKCLRTGEKGCVFGIISNEGLQSFRHLYPPTVDQTISRLGWDVVSVSVTAFSEVKRSHSQSRFHF